MLAEDDPRGFLASILVSVGENKNCFDSEPYCLRGAVIKSVMISKQLFMSKYVSEFV